MDNNWSNFNYFIENADKARMAKNLALDKFPFIENQAEAAEAEKQFLEMSESELRDLCIDRFHPGM